ncbi:immunoglobulin domain-containing protein, partial [Flavobacterium restrictum]
MKNKLLLFLLFVLFLGNRLIATNYANSSVVSKKKSELVVSSTPLDTIKKNRKAAKANNAAKTLGVLLTPTVVAGSSCGDGVKFTQVNLYANGANVSDVIEWFTSQTAVTPVFTGTNFSPSIKTTTTYYVQSKSADGLSVSIRVPVVGSIYFTPPAVTLSASPTGSPLPLCFGTSVTFTATGGADLFEFSVDGVVAQAMSPSKTFTTSTLNDGQVVRVRSRYAVTLDGTLTEKAWGTGNLEDNGLSATLSANAATGYINGLKISPTENKLVFGIPGKLLNYRRILLFLDTKAGGYNVSNYGDENGSLPEVRAFNYFNNNPSTFDSYFEADYCIAIATDAGETNYYADVIELKSGNSIKTYLGTAATGSPTSVMGINKGNTGIGDYNLGFEVEVLKSLIGYTTGDIKFFALTMQDNFPTNYNVTNSFLSPERSGTADYGSGAINYNLKDPNPVYVSSSALTPCYSEDTIAVSIAQNPSVASVGPNQSNCILTSTALGGNTPAIGTGLWSIKSGPGTATFSDASSGSSTATVSTVGEYVFTWTITSGTCTASTADISVIYDVTKVPVIGVITQPTCAVNTGSVIFSGLPATGTWTITPSTGTAVTGTGSSYEFKNLLAATNYTFVVTDGVSNCPSLSTIPVAIDAIPLPPTAPVAATVVQPTCGLPSG